MNLERIFNIILRIYPRAFRERFGTELQLDFLAEASAAETSLEVWRLTIDAFSCAIWERLQVTAWVRPVAAASCISICALDIALVTRSIPPDLGLVLQIAVFGSFMLFFPAAVIATLERVPHRLELIGALLIAMCGILYTGLKICELWFARDRVLQIFQEQLWLTNVFALVVNLGILLLGLAGFFVTREHWRIRTIKVGIVCWMVWSVANFLINAPLRAIPFFLILAMFACVFAMHAKTRDVKTV